MGFLEDDAAKAEDSGDLETAFRLWKNIATRNQDATSFFSYGRLAHKLEKWEEAESALARALRLDPNFSLAMEGMGVLWAERTDRRRGSLANGEGLVSSGVGT